MPKVTFDVIETIERTTTYTLNIKPENVTESYPDSNRPWEAHVEDYITDNWEDKFEAIAKHDGETQEDITAFEITNAEVAGDPK